LIIERTKTTSNTLWYCSEKAKRVVIAITGKSGIERMLIHRVDQKGDTSTTTMDRLDEFQVTLLPHPPHSLDISSCDFSFCGRDKHAMRGQ
jgi:hypothetical protein